MREKGVAPISRKTIEAETLIKQFLDDDLISLNAKQIDQLSRGRAEDVFENIFGSKAKELITGKNTNESLNEVYNKLKTTKDARGRLPDDPNFDPSDINFKDGGSVSEDVKKLLKEEFIELINADPESFPDTNAGFRRFLKRKGSPVFNYKKGGKVAKEEKSKAEEPLSNYESYSENELLSSLDAKMPNLEIIEDELITIPMFEGKDIVPKGSRPVMPSEEYFRQRLFLDLAKGGRVKKRKRYADGGTYPTSVNAPNGIQYELIYSPFSGKPLYRPKYDPSRSDLNYYGTDPEEFFKTIMSTGTSTPTTTEIPSTGFFSGPAYDTYSQARSDAYANSPNKFTYDVTANQAAGQFAQDKLKELLGDNILSQTLGTIGTVAAVPLAFYSSPFHEAAQVINEGRMEPGSGVKGFYDAFMNELPLSTAANRAAGVLKSIPGIGESIYSGAYNLGESLANLKSNISNPTIQRTVNVGSYDPGLQTLGASIGNLDYSTMNALRNNADLLNTITGQTANMANGGLTKTIPPVRGPNPQGVESLFKKRYN
jgi:hypothetical protein